MNKKMIVFCSALAFMIGVLSLYGIKDVGAQEADAKNRAVRIPVSADDKDQAFEVPTAAPGEIMTVYIDLPADDEEADKVIESPIDITDLPATPARGSKFHLRGGLSTGGVGGTDHSKPSFSGGLIGEISTNSLSLQGTFRAGNCLSGRGLGLNSGLALLGRVQKKVRAGLGADLLYCSDVFNTPKEKASERIVGGSFLLDVEIANHFVVGGSIGIGVATVPVLGGLSHTPVLYGGISIAYLWGGNK